MKGNNKQKTSPYGLLSRSILNGIVGDYLEQTNNPLAIQMGLYHRLNRIDLQADLSTQLADITVTNKVVILVHGLTNLETVWDYEQTPAATEENGSINYGSQLQKDYGYTPLFVRYNTGLDIKSNGDQFSQLLEELFAHYPIKIDELILIGFSMGGLLLRLAQMEAIENERKWLSTLAKCMYIGTPHEGSPLEKFGHITGEVVRNIPLDYLNHWAQWIDIRSQGIKDLKLGLKSLSNSTESEPCGSFFPGSKHYFISGSVGQKHDNVLEKVFGDSLVRKNSAAPSSKPLDSQHTHFVKLPHIPLAHSEKVYEQLVQWMEETPSKVKLKRYTPKKQSRNKELKNESSELSNQDLISGVIDITSDTANKVLNTTETMHQSISAVPFGMLKKIPVIKQFSAPVEVIHNNVSNLVFDSLKSSSKKARQVSKRMKK